MSSPLRDAYLDLPQPRPGDDPEDWAVRMRDAFRVFRERVAARYTEGTLQRLLASADVTTRRAAVLALGQLGTMDCNAALAERLHDADALVQRMAADALWEVWFRGGSPDENAELQRVMQTRDLRRALADLTALIGRAPRFAEAVNQRAILHWRLGDFHQSIADCRRVMQLNPHHFGAQSGMGRCFLKLRNTRAALDAFEMALRIHPGLDGVEDSVRRLREALGL